MQRVFANVSKGLKIKSPGLSPKSNEHALLKERNGRHREKGGVKMEAEIGVMQPQTKECLKPPESGRVKEDSFLEPLKGEGAC